MLSAVRAGDVGNVRAVLRAERDTAVARDAHACSALHWALMLVRASYRPLCVRRACLRPLRRSFSTPARECWCAAPGTKSTTVLDVCARESASDRDWRARASRGRARGSSRPRRLPLCARSAGACGAVCGSPLAAVSGAPTLPLSQWAIVCVVKRKTSTANSARDHRDVQARLY